MLRPCDPLKRQARRFILAYQENNRKFAVVVNKKSVPSVMMNGLSHICLGLGDREQNGDFLAYENEESGLAAGISRYPVIVFSAKNSNQVARFVEEANAAGLNSNYFTMQMIGESAEAQINNNCSTPFENLEFVCAATFGDREIVDPLTRRFSLFK